MTLLSYFATRCDSLSASCRFGSARTYTATLTDLKRFLNGCDISLKRVDADFIRCYESWLKLRHLASGTVSFYIRILRAVLNHAARCGLVSCDASMFADVYTGIPETARRAVTQAVVRKLFAIELAGGSALGRCRDLFLLSYCCRGMAFVDMAYLRRVDLRDGYMQYRRQKTGKLMRVHLDPLIMQLINRNRAPSGPYLLNILTDNPDPQAVRRSYQSALRTHNRNLKKLAEMIGCESLHLSSYTARHTWATVARDNGVDISVIQAAMGHSTEQITRIYLTSINHASVDSAQSRLIELLAP